MAKVFKKKVRLWDHKKGGWTDFQPGALLPEDLEDRFDNPSAFFSDEEVAEMNGEDQEDDGLDRLSIKKLKELGEQMEVDLTGLVRKQDIIKAIRDNAGDDS